jgi:hypothetical protein
MLNEHHPGERQRYASKRIGAEAAEEQRVERDHPGDGEKIEHVRRRQA